MELNKKIIFIGIDRDENGLFQSIHTELGEQVVRKFKEENQLYEIFHMEYLSSVENIAEYLILRGDAKYCFCRSEKNQELVNALVKQIQLLQPESSIEYVEDNTSAKERKMELYSMTFARGYYMSLAGIYPVGTMDGTIKHIKIKENFVQMDCLDRMNELCNANSSICVECSESLESSEKQRQYANVKRYLNENRILPMNFVCSDSDSLYINGEQVNEVKKIIKLPYHRWKENRRLPTEQVLFTLDREEDIKLFQEDLEFYRRMHTLAQSPFLTGQIHMFCRFLSEQDCTVKKLPQVTIKENGRICPCNQEKWEIGSILESSLHELRANCTVIDENMKAEKKCITCESRKHCSKCSFMPEFLAEHFCELRKNYPFISDLFYETNVVIELIRKYKVFNQTPLTDIKVSNRYFQSITEDSYTGERVKEVLFYHHVFIVYSNNTYTVWSPVTGKIYGISKEYAVVAEFIFRRIPQKEFQQLLVDMFGYGEEDSQFIVSSSMKLFKQSQLL